MAVGILIGYLACLAVTATVGARAHLPRPFRADHTLKQRERVLEENTRHARYVAAVGRGAPRRHHARASRWLEQELRDVQTQLAALTGIVPEPWYSLAVCESGRRPPAWHINTGNGYEGGLQFLNSTWIAAGGLRYAAHAYQATPLQQVAIARGWLARTSWAQWPACSAALGLR